MPTKVTAAEYAEKMARRLKASTEDIRRGVERVDVPPTAKAAAKKTKMLTNLTEAVQSGKWEAGLNRVTLEDWKRQTLEKGIGRIASGIDGAREKIEVFGAKLLAYEDRVMAEVEKMPDLTLEDSIARMGKWTREMAKFKR